MTEREEKPKETIIFFHQSLKKKEHTLEKQPETEQTDEQSCL